ncbi:MAG: hypothetical protein ACKOX6_00905 [Bdellovibrio sp.]
MALLFRANKVGDGFVYRAATYYPPAKQLMFRPMRRNGVAIFNNDIVEPPVHEPVVYDAAVEFGFSFGFTPADVREFFGDVEFGFTMGLETGANSGFAGDVAFGVSWGMEALPQMQMNADVEIGFKMEMTAKGRIAGWDEEPPRGPPDWVPDPKPRLF